MRKSLWGWLSVVVFLAIPGGIWLNMYPLAGRFGSTTITLISISQLSALTGVILFSLAFFINNRFDFIESIFGGLNKVYIAHHLIGSFAFVSVLLHVGFILLAYLLVSPRVALSIITPGSSLVMTLGVVGIFIMTLVLVLTFYVNLPYHIWAFVHRFMGIAFLVSALHVYLVESDMSVNPVLRVYVLFFIAIGILSFLYKTIFGRLTIRRFDYEVASVDRLGSIVTLRLKPCEKTMDYAAGQFVFISFDGKPISSESHPFSISSTVYEENLEILIKDSGDYTHSLIEKVKPGLKLKIEGPYGKFTFKRAKHVNQVWIAGGIGITPFIGLAKSLHPRKYKVDLIYSYSGEDNAVGVGELRKVEEKNKNFRLHVFDTTIKGRVDGGVVERLTGEFKDKSILLCGPSPMMIALKKQFKAYGVKLDNIISEEFELA